jgi:hypothetical protein
MHATAIPYGEEKSAKFVKVLNRYWYRFKTLTLTKICCRQAANFGKSGELLLHQERPHIKSQAF